MTTVLETQLDLQKGTQKQINYNFLKFISISFRDICNRYYKYIQIDKLITVEANAILIANCIDKIVHLPRYRYAIKFTLKKKNIALWSFFDDTKIIQYSLLQ